jgi:hypothetical protein
MDSDDLSKSEFYTRRHMVELCINIANEYDHLIDGEFVAEDGE